MGLSHSPKIVTNGLVFAYDMGNTNKSWKGAPTTNRLPNATAFTGWSNYYRTLARTSFTTEFGTTGWRFINQPSWSGIVIGYNVPSTGTYTFSAYYKYLGGSASNNGGSVYVSGWGGNDVATYVNKSLVDVWQRVQITLNLTNVSGTFYLISFGGTDSGTTSPDYTSFEVTMPMIESGSFATPFVDGTRSNTQTILDLTNISTVTVNGLNYTSNNYATINGTSSYIAITNSVNLRPSTELTIEYIIKGPNEASWRPILGYGNGDYGNGNYLVWTEGGTLNSLCRINNGGTVTEYRQYPGVTISSTTYQQMTFTMKVGQSIRSYRNGVDTNTPTSLPAGGSFHYPGTASPYQIGGLGSAWLVADVPFVRLYNRELSAAEVQQNFNALRGRFGI